MAGYKKRLLIALLGAALTCAACGSGGSGAAQDASASATALSGNVTIFAAASLTESFNELKAIFELQNPAATVALNFGSSSSLAAQIAEQGGADVFASADQANMEKVVAEGLVEGKPAVFIKNRLQIVVAPGNPERVRGLSDLAKPELKVVLAAPQVPVGRYGREALAKAGVSVKPVSEAADVKGVVGPVTLGEADAGIVYATDVEAAGDKAAAVDIPEGQNVVGEYPIGVLKHSTSPQLARAFVDLVLSDEGRSVLTGKGFLAP
jgi:molybdate transport system substrate-binding protein